MTQLFIKKILERKFKVVQNRCEKHNAACIEKGVFLWRLAHIKFFVNNDIKSNINAKEYCQLKVCQCFRRSFFRILL